MASAVVFAYHDVGVRCLHALLAHDIDVRLVVTHQDDPRETIWFESVARLAAAAGIATTTPADPATPALQAQVAALAPDFIFSCYYRHMLPLTLLRTARVGAYNMHGSLLPKYRGRVPVNWAIIQGETQTGATLHEMVAKPDAGGIIAQQAVPIFPNDRAIDVFRKVTVAAEWVMSNALPDLIAGRARPQAQDLAAGSYFGGRTPADGRIDPRRDTRALHNLIRAVAPPYPGAYCEIPAGRLVIEHSYWRGERSDIKNRPALFVDDQRAGGERILLRGADGGLLTILAARLNERVLTPAHLRSFGQEVSLTTT